MAVCSTCEGGGRHPRRVRNRRTGDYTAMFPCPHCRGRKTCNCSVCLKM